MRPLWVHLPLIKDIILSLFPSSFKMHCRFCHLKRLCQINVCHFVFLSKSLPHTAPPPCPYST
uniref:Uncharacterized protein n=1 Tax=Anguilla anguilla TaxID=7936 RepID=A0A0E9WLC3_ANGAN